MRRLAAGLTLAALLAACGGDEAPRRATTVGPGEAAPTATTGPARTTLAALPGAHRAPDEPVPILMYHVLNTPLPGTPEPELWVSRADFEAQTEWLASRGYHAVTLQQVWDAWHEGGLLPSKPIVISFDDGYHSHVTNALPVLRARGWPAVLNLQVNQTREDLEPPEVRRLIRAGWEIDAHTYNHPDLTTVDAAGLRHEIGDAREELRRTYGVPVNFFCYPAGRTDARVVEAVRAAGYLGATTTVDGLASPDQPPYELRRIRVNGSDGVEGLAANLQR
ncbi:MAG TPA: polysaccharide deacetylase family protein [Solirubrobacteraceae bacterium]|nr:polysaccharide deacetylase family protein [Solirubrobacteraceae bacterium]